LFRPFWHQKREGQLHMATAKRYCSCTETVMNKTNHPELQKNDRTRKLSHAPSRRNSSCQLLERSPDSAAWNCSLQYSTVDLHATVQLDAQPSRMAQKVSTLSDHITPFLGQFCSSLAFAPAGGASSMSVRVRPQLSVHPARQRLVHLSA
jgi:hypothetical protein